MTQTIINLGTGGAALNGQNGSTAGLDSNDAQFLDWPGDNGGNYVYLPGVAGNRLSIPHEASFNITGDLDLRVRVALDDWTPPAAVSLISKRTAQASITAWRLRVETAGTLGFVFHDSGTGTNRTTVSTSATGITDGLVKWIRVTLQANTGSGFAVTYFTSDDAVTWTQLGSVVTGSPAAAITTNSTNVTVGAHDNGTDPLSGQVYRAQILDGIGGTTVLDVDTLIIGSGAATSFTALTGQTVTINRSTSGRKSVAVVSPVWLFGTDDYMEVVDNALIDFDAATSFTIVAAYRAWATLATNVARVAKKTNTTAATQGWLLGSDGTTATLPRLQAGDGGNGASATGPARSSGALTITAGVRNVVTDTLTTYLNGAAGTAVTDTTTGSLANSEAVRIGRLSGAGTGYADMELLAVAIFRRALSASEISAITSYYQARLS